ncbi:MAG: hypothetical protein ACI3YK_07145 [Eubacteriales bacterium]
MRRIMMAISRFMAGRNGMDYFGYCLWWIYLILFLAEIIVGFFSYTAGMILSVLLWVLFFYMIFRMFSRNIPARARENLWWGKVMSKTPFGKKKASRFGSYGSYNQGYNQGYGQSYRPDDYQDYTNTPKNPPKKKKVKLPRDKDHVYRTCPMCLANIRLPKKKGEHQVRCPKCGNLFEIKI